MRAWAASFWRRAGQAGQGSAPPFRGVWGGSPACPGGPPIVIIGHRGVRGPAPENTMAAFEEAARQGADAIELDTLVCGSGELVCIHDPTLSRVTQGADSRVVASLPYEELRRVDVGGGERAPLLAEVLSFARRRGLGVNVEIKREAPDRGAVVRACARLLRGWDPDHPLIVSSFDPWMLAAFGAVAPRVPTALLVHRSWYYRYAVSIPGALGAAGVHVERTIASPALIKSLKRRGYWVSVWTVNSAREALDLAALGVDSLITDVPGEIRAVVAPRTA